MGYRKWPETLLDLVLRHSSGQVQRQDCSCIGTYPGLSPKPQRKATDSET